jgi:hypothetical protein
MCLTARRPWRYGDGGGSARDARGPSPEGAAGEEAAAGCRRRGAEGQ